MPTLFHLDDYDGCMLLGEKALYCTFSYQLEPLEESNEIWEIIKVIK